MKKYSFHIIAVLFLSTNLSAQLIPVDDNASVKQYPYTNPAFNRIFSSSGLDSFYQKLYNLKKTGKGIVTVVHIGDSHIQADFLSAVVRKNLQQFFGNAGRGLVFPYQLAQSNAPPDISSSSNVTWQFNRVAHPEIPITPGISGYCIKTNASGASINIALKNETGPQTFNRIKFFLDTNAASTWILQVDNNSTPFLVKKEDTDTSSYSEVLLEKNSNPFSLASIPSTDVNEFYGVSL